MIQIDKYFNTELRTIWCYWRNILFQKMKSRRFSGSSFKKTTIDQELSFNLYLDIVRISGTFKLEYWKVHINQLCPIFHDQLVLSTLKGHLHRQRNICLFFLSEHRTDTYWHLRWISRHFSVVQSLTLKPQWRCDETINRKSY